MCMYLRCCISTVGSTVNDTSFDDVSIHLYIDRYIDTGIHVCMAAHDAE